MSKNSALDALDREFNAHGSTMHLTTYNARWAEIQTRGDAPAPGPAPETYVTKWEFAKTVGDLAKAFAAFGNAATPLPARIAALEKRVNVLQEVPGGLAIAATVHQLEKTLRMPTAPVYDAKGKLIGAQRVDNIEGATAAHGTAAADLTARNADLQVRLEKSDAALVSAERRLSRHGEHLARLESRLQALEKAGPR